MFYTVFLQMGGRVVFYNGTYKCMEFFGQNVFWFMAFWAGCDNFFAYAGLGLFGGYGIFLRLRSIFVCVKFWHVAHLRASRPLLWGSMINL